LTVSELIEALRKEDPNKEVMVMLTAIMEAVPVNSVYADRNQYDEEGSYQVVMLSPAQKD